MERRSGMDRRALSSAEKAATLLLAMGQENAARILKYFSSDDVDRIVRTASRLGAIGAPVLENVVHDFEQRLAIGSDLLGSAEVVEQLVQGALPGGFLVGENAGLDPGLDRGRVWSDLQNGHQEKLFEWLVAVHPQAAAVVISRLDPDSAAQALAHFRVTPRSDLLRRLLALRDPDPNALAAIESCLLSLVSTKTKSVDTDGALKKTATIVNKLAVCTIEETLCELDLTHRVQSDALRSRLFQFDDIAAMSQGARATLFDQISTERVVLALKGANENVCVAVLGALSARARRLVESELQSGSSGNSRDIAKARRAIADVALSLAEEGKLELPNKSTQASGSEAQQP